MNFLKRFFTPATAGETEIAMSDTPTTATPPAASGGLSESQITKIIGDVVAQAIKPIGELVGKLSEGQKAQGEAIGKLSQGVKPDDVAKAVADQLASHQATQATAAAASQKKADLRKKVIETHLKGVPDTLVNLPDTDDEAALTAAATALRKTLEGLPGVKLPNVGGVSNDGGATPAAGVTADKYTPANSGLSAGVAKYASGLKLPGAAPAPAPAAATPAATPAK
jgi:hypothetical protein